MAGNRLTIAIGKNLTELNVDLASTGSLSEKDLDQVAGGSFRIGPEALNQ